MKAYTIIMFGFMFLLFAGCINLDIFGEGENGEEEEEENGEVELNPSFSILYPSGGAEIETMGETVDVEILLQISDITLTAPSTTNVYGEGHFVLSLDGESETISETSHTFRDVEVGEHTLAVEFVNNDGSSYSPALMQTIYFSVVLQDGVVVGPEEYSITLENNAFYPDELNIKEGDIVTFVNQEAMPHAIKIKQASTGEDVATSSPLPTGESFVYTFEEEGMYDFSSMTIPSITGTVVVSK